MKYLINLTIVISIFSLIGCGGSNSGDHGLDMTVSQLSSPIDPTCGMNLEHHAIADTFTYKGKIYGFCNPGCKEAFVEDPEKFLSEKED